MGLIALALAIQAAAAPSLPVRTSIGSFAIEPSKPVTHVEMWRVDFAAGQAMPEHMHSVPIACVVSRGSFAASIGHDRVRTVGVGETTIEPAGVVVHYFRNLSPTQPAQLFCMILAGPYDKQFSVMLGK